MINSADDPRAFRLRMEAMRDLLDFLEYKHFDTSPPTQPTLGVIENGMMDRIQRAQRMIAQSKRCPECKSAETRQAAYDREEAELFGSTVRG